VALRFVVPTLATVEIVFGLELPIDTGPVVGVIAADVLALVPIEVAKLAVVAGSADAGVWEVVLVELGETAVLPGAGELIEFVPALTLAVVVPWLRVLPTWPMWTSGLILPDPEFASLELANRWLARDR
jgi:hypothetical protein